MARQNLLKLFICCYSVGVVVLCALEANASYTINTTYKTTPVGTPQVVYSPLFTPAFDGGCFAVLVGAPGGNGGWLTDSAIGGGGGGEGAKVAYNYLKALANATLWVQVVLYDNAATVEFYAGAVGQPKYNTHILTTLYGGENGNVEGAGYGGHGGDMFNQDFRAGLNASTAGGHAGPTCSSGGAGQHWKSSYPDGGGWIVSNISYMTGFGGMGAGDEYSGCQPGAKTNAWYGDACTNDPSFGAASGGGAGSHFYTSGFTITAQGGTSDKLSIPPVDGTFGGGGAGETYSRMGNCTSNSPNYGQSNGGAAFVTWLMTDPSDCARVHMDDWA